MLVNRVHFVITAAPFVYVVAIIKESVFFRNVQLSQNHTGFFAVFRVILQKLGELFCNIHRCFCDQLRPCRDQLLTAAIPPRCGNG